MGQTATASTADAIAIGRLSNSSGTGSIAISNFSSTASGHSSSVLGRGLTASGFSSRAFGFEVQVGTGVAQINDATADVGNYSMGFGLGDASTATLPQITGNETMAIFFGDQQGEDITATNVLALEGGSLLLSNDSGTACAAA
ncbi:MAG: hypothetical protein AAGA15_04395, partial [Pseudomonadota bacterium]